MRILLSSHFFHPSIGGIEEVSFALAHEFVAAGHEVKVITQTKEDSRTSFPFEVHRRPGASSLIALVKWCDVFFHNNISLRYAWPLLLIKRPWVIAHHTWIARTDGRIGFRDRVKQAVLKRATNITMSKAMAETISASVTIIGNPYRDDLFQIHPDAPRDRELVFLGRLVSDKGADILLNALALLGKRGLHPRLTIIGAGPEEDALHEQSAQLGLRNQVVFAGKKTGGELVQLLNLHQIMVVPSRWQEPFGLVALEGAACGCVVIGSECGGLPDAIGPCGITYKHQDTAALADSIEQLLTPGADLEKYRSAAPAHLANHTAQAVAARYLQVLQAAVNDSKPLIRETR